MIMTPVVSRFLRPMKQKLGYLALAAFFLETTIISWAIQRRRILQEKENKDRIGLALTNYSLR
ncbi:MAG: hypothetical protein KJ879_00920 [Nanoarchaeota archaeon]|nr:hypothetical protein [Nanoarchaeota archaeon]